VKITKLPDGDYKLVEDNTHTGYIIKQKEIDFKITNGVLTGNDINGIVTFTQAGGTNLALITVINEPGAALPATGSPGTTIIYILGTMLTCLAGTILALRRKRRAA